MVCRYYEWRRFSLPALLRRAWRVEGPARRPSSDWRARAGILLVLSLTLLLTRAQSPAMEGAEVASPDEFYRLSPDAIQSGRALRFRGTIVYSDPAWGQLHFYDGRLTHYFFPSSEIQTPLTPGQIVEITARSALINGEYRCTNASVRILGRGELPAPIPTSLAGLTNFNQFVEITGHVRGVHTGSGRVALKVEDAGESCVAYVLNYLRDPQLRQWVGTHIRLRGVNGSRMSGGRLEALVYVASTNDISVLRRPAQTIRELPAVPIGGLSRADVNQRPANLIRIQGLVGSSRSGGVFTIKDPTGTISIRSDSAEAPATDQRVDVWGFLEESGSQLLLADAFFDPVGPADAASTWVAPAEPLVPDPALRRIESTREIRALPRSEAARHYPVRLNAIVTYADAEWGNGFLQDETGGIYVVLSRTNQLAPGQRVEVTGFTDTGAFVPFVIQPAFVARGTTDLPVPAKVRLGDLMTGEYDSQWVELEGVVRQCRESGGRWDMELATQNGRFRSIVLSSGAGASPPRLIDARVRVLGACGAELNARGRQVGVVLHVPSFDLLEVVDPAPVDPFSISTTPLGTLAQGDPQSQQGRRVRVQGVVTYEAPGRSLVLQDSSGALRVWVDRANQVQVGETLDVIAWPAQGDFSPELHEGVFRVTRPGRSPRPVAVTAEQILRFGTNDAQLVQIDARLLERTRSTGAPVLLLQQGSVIFEADFPASAEVGLPASLQPGAQLRLTGICSIRGDQRRDPKSFQLLLRSPADLRVLQSAPWWTPRHAAIGLVAALLVIASGLAWVVLLRRQVARQTELIRQRMATEAILERRYQDLVENASDIVYTADLDGRLTSLNQAGQRAMGYSRAEALGLRLEDLAAPECRGLVRERFAARQRGADLPGFEIRMLTRDGRSLDLEVSSRLVSRDGRPRAVEGIARDITARKQAEEARLEAERKYHAIFDNAVEGIFQSTPDGRLLSVNPALAKMCGYESPEQIQSEIKDLGRQLYVDSQQRLHYQREMERKGAVSNFEFEMRRRDGRHLWVSETSRAVRDAEGRLLYYEGALVDITERRRAEESLRRSEERFGKVFRASPIAVSITRLEDGCYFDANESFLRLVEYRREELIGHTSQELNIWARPGDRTKMVARLRETPSVRDLEMPLRAKSGQIRQTLASLEIIELDGQPCVLGIIHDVTERLQLEAQFRQAQKMESIGQLAAGVAHDFNNLLTVIQGYTAILESGTPSAEDARESLQQISEASRRAANLTHQLLAFSRRQVMRPSQVDLNEVLNNLARMLPRLLGEHVALQVHGESGLPAVFADIGMLEQVVMNLAVNARDAMPNGGQLILRTGVLRLNAQQLQENPEAGPGDYVCLSVSDTGCGMDAATLGHVFEPFFTTKDVGKGTGLGLATVYGIVKQHKGWVEVTSQVGQGSTFRVYLPAFNAAGEPAPVGTALPPPTIRRRETLLLVEDELALRRLAKRILEKHGYRVLEAVSGAEALEVWARRDGKIHVLVTDMVMPGGVSGSVLARRLQTEDPELRVLYTSGYSVEMVGAGSHLREGVNFLQKPYLPAALINAVLECTSLPDGGSHTAFTRRA